MELALWIVQILLAVVFVGAGFNHATHRDNPRPGMEWMQAVPAPLMTTIGVLEILGGIGLVLPALTGILPWLTALAATALAVLMLFAAVFHARRPGEGRLIVGNLVLVALAAFVAYGRFVLYPFS